MAIDLKAVGIDPWASVGGSVAGGGAAGSILGGASPVLGALGGDWLGIGSQLLGAMLKGKSSQSAAASDSAGQLNTSGWVIGKGDAAGGTLDSRTAAAWPWYAWAAGALVAIAIIKRAA